MIYFLAEIDVKTCPCELTTVFRFIINIMNLIKIVIPILLIIFGSLDLGKAVVAGDDKEVAKAQNMLVKRVITAAAVFFIVPLITLVMSLVSDAKWTNCLNKENLKECMINPTNVATIENV
jgi:preprotein translocase subunit SecG